ncbi:MAG: hypothetical protein OEX18_07335 [Candidatus Krumholzibacteria bacterium]|nr:hypothetical protein [Candidatus Krumholzibacteria bacterium]MDH4337081.1 hypothetical protein [Candidatus Krumholzibacteria bacterium]MDH5268618.1 hypothetical protein [Candidatus Krumholzibacteria bacterium]
MRIIAMVLCLVFLAAPAGASLVGLYTEPLPGACAVVPMPFIPFSVYVVHHLSTGTKALSFRVAAEFPAGMISLGGTPIGFLCVGDCDPYQGVSVSRQCSSADWAIFRLDFFPTQPLQSVTCYQLRVVGYPGNDVVAVDCNDVQQTASGRFFSFVANSWDCWDCATPVESTTWGRVKSLYR